MGCLLPFLSIGGALFSPNKIYPDWWTSISITYYSSPVLIAVLSAVSFFLILYRGYNCWDTDVNTTAGIAGLCVVCFPCEASWIDMSTRVGLFWLPVNVTRWVHYSAAFALFGLNAAFFDIKWTVIVNETIILMAFGISWLVKGHVFDKWLGE